MRLFGIDKESKFTEYQPQIFKREHQEKSIEDWLDQNPEAIVENGGLFIIGRQVTTNLDTSIDLLGLDRMGNTAVIELKRDKTPRDTLAQALEYASFVAMLSVDQLEEILRKYTEDENASLGEMHRTFFSLKEADAVSFNKNQRIVIIGTEIIQPIRQSASYLRQKGLPVTCLEFSYFQAKGGEQLLSIDGVIGEEPLGGREVTTGTQPKITETQFLEACDEMGRAVFEPLLAMGKTKGFPIHWGSVGFSFNVDFEGSHIALCFGYPKPTKPNRTPQSLWTSFSVITRRIKNSAPLIDEFKRKFAETGLFVPAGGELKFLIQDKLTDEQVAAVLSLIEDLSREVKKQLSLDGE